MYIRRAVLAAGAALVMVQAVRAGTPSSFWNWESPHVHPLDLTPDGGRLLAVNTADNRLELFTVDGASLVRAGSIPVGLEPVTVRARTNSEAWVVNHVSDSISIVDLDTLNVTRTLFTASGAPGITTHLGDEPTDVVFAGDPPRAFVCLSQLNLIKVYDPADLSAVPIEIPIAGEDPRGLATDGTSVYAAIFESGNVTTILDDATVSSAANPYAGTPNPPPNAGAGFDPPIDGGLPVPPEVGLIVRRDAGAWLDDNGGDWSSAVTWDLHDHDVAVIDAGSLAVTYVTGLMNLNMALAVRSNGDVLVVGTEAFNEVRFEPVVNGRFVEVRAALLPGGAGPATLGDLNPHLDYTTSQVPQGERDESLGDPRGVAWNAAGDRAFVTGMGSNNLIAVDAALGRLERTEVGQGPTGIVVHDAESVLYVLNRFDATISIVDAGSFSELEQVAFPDPTPGAIRDGRPHLYDTHTTSGLGHVSCASCHVDGRMDQLAWDLGDPEGAMKTFNQVCNFNVPIPGADCDDWHPLKGPMATQTFMGIIGTEPFHWRGDREGLAEFNPAFESLMGDDEQLSGAEMDQFEAFVATLAPPPNPFRTIFGQFTTLANGGNAQNGNALFLTQAPPIVAGVVSCADCHEFPAGTNGQLTSDEGIMGPQSMKIAQLRNLYEKTGFDYGSTENNRGFGFTHDGSSDSIVSFLEFPLFDFAGDQERLDMEAFLFSFANDTHAATGVQITLRGEPDDPVALRNLMVNLTNVSGGTALGLVAKGIVDGELRGYMWDRGAGVFQSDRVAETVSAAELDAGLGTGAEVTYTLVPFGTEPRIGIDRDEDGFLDRDELDQCANPADPGSTPGRIAPDCCAAICAGDPYCCDVGWDALCADLSGDLCSGGACAGDANGDSVVNVDDLTAVISDWGTDGSANGGDLTGSSPGSPPDGIVNVNDLTAVISGWGPCP